MDCEELLSQAAGACFRILKPERRSAKLLILARKPVPLALELSGLWVEQVKLAASEDLRVLKG